MTGRFFGTFLAGFLIPSPTSLANEVTEPRFGEMREAGEAVIRSKLNDPSSAQFEWPAGFIEGTWPTIWKNRTHDGYITCGPVNAKNRMGGYVGQTLFVIVISDGAVTYADIGKPDGSDWTSRSCSKSMSVFPAPQTDMLAKGGTNESMADELTKLAKLRDDGVLTPDEFQQQKQRLLGR